MPLLFALAVGKALFNTPKPFIQVSCFGNNLPTRIRLLPDDNQKIGIHFPGVETILLPLFPVRDGLPELEIPNRYFKAGKNKDSITCNTVILSPYFYLVRKSIMEKRLQREFDKLMQKNQGRCSICKSHYSENDLVYICMGYDKRRKLQTTTRCCYHKLEKVLQIGFCGYAGLDDMDEIMKGHPLYHEFHGKNVEVET